MYIDDELVAAPGKMQMMKLLVAVIEAIFIVMGQPEENLSQNHLALDKWVGQLIQLCSEILSTAHQRMQMCHCLLMWAVEHTLIAVNTVVFLHSSFLCLFIVSPRQ